MNVFALQCTSCNSVFIHHRMAPNPQEEIPQPPPLPLPQQPLPLPQPQPLPAVQNIAHAPGTSCPSCGSLRGNRTCGDGYCKRCCQKAAAANPARKLCSERKHQLHPGVPIAANFHVPEPPPHPLHQQLLPAPQPDPRAAPAPLGKLVPLVWEQQRDLALKMRDERLLHEQKLQLHQNLLKQSHNLVWYSEVFS